MLVGESIGVAFAGEEGRGETEAGAAAEILIVRITPPGPASSARPGRIRSTGNAMNSPHRYSDVIIPGSAPNFPQITAGPVEVRNLHLQANSSLQALTALIRVLGGPQ